MKGIILAGGKGSRLFPNTTVVNKQLLPVHDKPMIYYALTTLLAASINDICIICNPEDIQGYKDLLGLGEQFGAKITYVAQENPDGIPQAFTLASKFIGSDPVALLLGDNIFIDNGEIRHAVKNFRTGAHIFGLRVQNPSQYGIVLLDDAQQPIGLVEKPTRPQSNYAVPGFYIFDSSCVFFSQTLQKSNRGELEIIDLLNKYLKNKKLDLTLLSRGTGWIDAGTHENHAIVSRYVEAMQQMHGILFGSPHEAALIRGFIDEALLQQFSEPMPDSSYKAYLVGLTKLSQKSRQTTSI